MNTIQADMTGVPIERIRGRFGEILDAAPTRPAAIGRRVAAYVLDAIRKVSEHGGACDR